MMRHEEHLTLKLFLMIVANDVLDSIAQLFMKKGLIQTGMANVTFGNLVEFIARNAASPLVVCGILIGLLNYLLWFVILYRVDLSIAMPVGSTIYIFVPLMSIFFLNEHVSALRWAGIFLIIIGIHCVAKSKQPAKGASQSC
jgi:drug/metabolite transporter (DMT)-like permease